jgi:hypothetical protein
MDREATAFLLMVDDKGGKLAQRPGGQEAEPEPILTFSNPVVPLTSDGCLEHMTRDRDNPLELPLVARLGHDQADAFAASGPDPFRDNPAQGSARRDEPDDRRKSERCQPLQRGFGRTHGKLESWGFSRS